MADYQIFLPPAEVLALSRGNKTQVRMPLQEPDGLSCWIVYQTYDRLWVPERFQVTAAGDVVYALDRLHIAGDPKWVEARNMPRDCCRYTLIVHNIRTHKLFDISEHDAQAEGVRNQGRGYAHAFIMRYIDMHGYEALEQNPELVVCDFELHRCNIDDLGPLAPVVPFPRTEIRPSPNLT